MKTVLLFTVFLVMVFLAIAFPITVGEATAAELLTVDGPTYQGIAPGVRDVVSFTQNVNTTLIEPVQVSCGVAGTYTTQNWYLRRFYLTADHGITLPISVSSVDFGVEQLAMADGSDPPPYDIQVKLFSIPSASPFTFAAMGAPIGTATVTITAADVGTIMTATFVGAGSVNPADHDLVVAIDAPDGSTIGAGLQFRPGGNSQGALWDAYLASADCGVNDPVAVSDIGFPDSQTIFVVNSSGIGTPVQNMSWGRVKELFQ